MSWKGKEVLICKANSQATVVFLSLAPSRGSPGGSSPGAEHPLQEVSRCGSAGRLTPPKDFCCRSGKNCIYFFMSKDADVPSVEPNPTWQGPSRRRELTSLLGPGCPQCAERPSPSSREVSVVTPPTSPQRPYQLLGISSLHARKVDPQQSGLSLIDVVKATSAELQRCDLFRFNSKLCLRRWILACKPCGERAWVEELLEDPLPALQRWDIPAETPRNVSPCPCSSGRDWILRTPLSLLQTQFKRLRFPLFLIQTQTASVPGGCYCLGCVPHCVLIAPALSTTESRKRALERGQSKPLSKSLRCLQAQLIPRFSFKSKLLHNKLRSKIFFQVGNKTSMNVCHRSPHKQDLLWKLLHVFWVQTCDLSQKRWMV